MSEPRLDVVQVITTLTTGGAERQLELLLSRTTHRQAVIALYRGGPVADSLRAAGHRVQVLGMDGWRKPLAWFRLALLLRRYRPDVVHVHLLAAQLWGIPAARLARVPVVVSTEHSLMEDTVEGRPAAAWLRRLYRVLETMTTHTVAVSSTTAQRLLRWRVPPARITVVDNGIDVDALAFSPSARHCVRAELGIDQGDVVIGAVGRLDPVKRLDQVVRASAPRLRSGGHVLVVAGAGDLLPDLRRLADELGVAASVRWLGARSDVPRVLSAMDVLVSASRDETFGLAVIEGLASGLPVVFAQCPALEELAVVPPWARHVDENDPDAEVLALADAVSAVLDVGRAGGADRADPVNGSGQARFDVPAELRERYDIGRAAARVDDLYLRLVGPRPTNRSPR